MSNLLERCLSFALQAHEGQVDKAGLPYILHPIHVMMAIKKAYNDHNEELLCVALLHDVMEDSPATVNDLKSIQGMTQRVIESLVLLTRKKGQSYKDYIQELIDSKNWYALMVKRYDLLHNADLTRLYNTKANPYSHPSSEDVKRYEKYIRALKQINAELGIKEYSNV